MKAHRIARGLGLARGLALWLGPSLFFVVLSSLVYGHFRIEKAGALQPAERAALVRCLRAGLKGTTPELDLPRMREGREAIVVRIYFTGHLRVRYSYSGGTLEQACQDIAMRMQRDVVLARLPTAARSEVAIRVDRVIGRGPLLEKPALLASMAIQPGQDGISVVVDKREEFFLAPELADSRLLVANRPLAFIPDLVFGFDRRKAEPTLAASLGMDTASFRKASKHYARVRVESFVESGNGEVIALEDDLPPSPGLSATSLRDGALAGGRYLVKHMGPTGRYIYLANLSTGRQSSLESGNYSLPRHAGTTYFLAELYRATHEDFLLEPIERAIGHLVDLVEEAGCTGVSGESLPFACVSERGSSTSDLGSTALAVVALAEYQRATGRTQFAPLMMQMAEFLLFMQRADGSFNHRYDWKEHKVDDVLEVFYYSGEATLALARVHKLTGEARYLEATRRSLDSLIGWYDFFLGGFFFGEEHWTCIAAEAAYPDLDDPRYLDFCEDYGRFLRRNQPEPGTFADQGAWAGAYYFTPFLAPQNTPAGSKTEAMISTYLLGRHHGIDSQPIKRQILLAMRYALAQQVRADGLFRVPPSVSGLGAIPGGPIDREVRIDYVQHVCSAMLRTAELLDENAMGTDQSKMLGSPP